MSDEGQKIIKLEVENAMRVSAIEITPTGALVEITGRNAQGKSSLMSAIEWAIRGGVAIPEEPIRKGQKQAKVTLTLDDMVISRTLRRRADGTIDNGEVRVEAADGSRIRNAHQLLQSMLGKLTIDPIAFAKAKPSEQFEALKQFVPGVNFAAIQTAHDKDYEARTEVNRTARTARAAAEQISVPDGTPKDPVDESGLVTQLEKAAEHNADIENRKVRRQAAAESVTRLKGEQAALAKRAADLRKQADDLDNEAAAKENEWLALQKKIDDAPALPEPIDTAEVKAAIDNARTANQHVASRKRRDDLLAEAARAEAESAAITAQMEAREAEKEKAIAASALPVPGIGFGKDKKGDPVVTLNGFPFGQASGAEQLRASLGIAMAASPKLRVILARDGNALDADSMAIVREMAQERGYQVWIETCRADDRPAFVIEDGRLRDAPAEEKAA